MIICLESTVLHHVQGWCPNHHQDDEGQDLGKMEATRAEGYPMILATFFYDVSFNGSSHYEMLQINHAYIHPEK